MLLSGCMIHPLFDTIIPAVCCIIYLYIAIFVFILLHSLQKKTDIRMDACFSKDLTCQVFDTAISTANEYNLSGLHDHKSDHNCR